MSRVKNSQSATCCSDKPYHALGLCKQCYTVKYVLARRGANVNNYNYGQLLSSQGGRCAICKQQYSKRLLTDHDHKTGQVRGLLCSRCNWGVGFLETWPYIFEAANYLVPNPFLDETIADLYISVKESLGQE